MSGQGFPVNEAEASKVQSSLGSIVEEVLRELLQKLNKDQEQTPIESEKENQVGGIDFDKGNPWDVPEIEIWQKGELVYGRTADTETCNFLDPKTEAKLELAVDLPVGTKVKGLEDTALIFRDQNDKVTELFKVDKDGVIIVNDINRSQNQNQNLNQVPKVEEQNKGNDQESSSERLRNVLAQQKQTPQIQALSQHVAQLQQQIKQQQQFIDQQLKYNKNQQNFNAELLKRVNENQRVQQERMKSRDPNWWQKGINKFAELKEIYQQRRQEQKVAKTLNQLWDKNTKKGAEVYQTDDYTLQRNNDDFTLKDKEDKVLFEYGRSSLGNTVFHNKLSSKDLSQIELLQERLKNKVVEGQFASVDINQKRLNEKSQKVADGFVDVARQQRDGKFIKEGSDYSISAKATGEINIWRKNENTPELIYSQSKKGQFNAMNDKDIGVLSKGLDQFKEKQQNVLAGATSSIKQSVQKTTQSVAQTISRGGR